MTLNEQEIPILTRVTGGLAALVLMAFVVVTHPPLAVAQPRLECVKPGAKFCTFDEVNYQGNLTLSGADYEDRCMEIDAPGKKSFRASTEFSSTLYETADCKGRSVRAERGSENPNIGFVARGERQDIACDSPEDLCLFDQPNYEGTKTRVDEVGQGECRNVDSGKQSYQAGARIEGYLYEKSNCEGDPLVAVGKGQENPNIGGVATSFKQACVSCRNNPTGVR